RGAVEGGRARPARGRLPRLPVAGAVQPRLLDARRPGRRPTRPGEDAGGRQERPGVTDTSFWEAARAQMLLDPTVANLNTGSFGPLPRVVFERVTELRRRLAEEPMDFLVRQAPPLLWQARERLAAFVGGDPRRLVFTANVTAAVNLVASALRLAAPGEILLTDHEYG